MIMKNNTINMNIDIAEEKTSKKSVLLVATFAAFLTPFLGSAVNLALPSIGKDLNANAIKSGMGNKQFYSFFSNISFAFWKACRYCRKKKDFFARNITIYHFNFSDYFLRKYYFSDNFKDISGIIQCNDLWNKPCNNYFCLSARRTGKSNGDKYNS